MVPRILFGILLGLVWLDPIGSGLRDGLELVYASGGVAQEPWVYDSVAVVSGAGSAGFDRCVTLARRGQPERAYCARGDTLFQREGAGTYAAIRPIGAGMELEVATASGTRLHYATGGTGSRLIGGRRVAYVETTIVTRDPEGVILRRLREEYAPSLLTALGGVFEVPEAGDGWRGIREFTLVEIRAGGSAGR